MSRQRATNGDTVAIFNTHDTAFVLNSHQVGASTWAVTMPLETLSRHVIALAALAQGANIPVVLTLS
ncbi:MAG: hypothetical protein ACJAVT_002283 [Yoonia sp.]|jgi:hypothetical protein|tara:strand:- start:1325 stop:1525 length:201 start_codon:yes stop_codon:yes gene_type:complete